MIQEYLFMNHFEQLREAALEPPRFHGMGLIQLYITKDVRLHVLHPDLPSAIAEGRIHDHVFDFESHVLAGELEHLVYEADFKGRPTHVLQPVEAKPDSTHDVPVVEPRYVRLEVSGCNRFAAGSHYTFSHKVLHEVAGRGLTVTVMTKTRRYGHWPFAAARIGHPVENAFPPGGWYPEDVLWDAIRDGFKAAGGEV